MSRQFDEYMEEKFEVLGETYEVVEPENFEELMQALHVREVIQTAISSLMHDEDSSRLCTLMDKQNDFIQEYLDSIGNFDNRYLISNIAFLAKKNSLRIGEIENMLGLSAGYISRTAKENSAKKLSIDVVWKIARLFEVDIRHLLEKDLQIPDSNSDLAAKFLEKVYRDTESGLVEWQCNGGVIAALDDSFSGSGLVTYEKDKPYYHSMYLNRDARFVLADDIFACENIALEAEVLIVPFYLENSGEQAMQYEFIFRHSIDDENDPKYGSYYFTRMFTTADDPFSHLDSPAGRLYKLLKDREYENVVGGQSSHHQLSEVWTEVIGGTYIWKKTLFPSLTSSKPPFTKFLSGSPLKIQTGTTAFGLRSRKETNTRSYPLII